MPLFWFLLQVRGCSATSHLVRARLKYRVHALLRARQAGAFSRSMLNGVVQAITALSFAWLEQARWRTYPVRRPCLRDAPARTGLVISRGPRPPSFAAEPQAAGASSRRFSVIFAPFRHSNSVPSIHIRWRIMASFRATATIAHMVLERFAMRSAQALSAL